MPLALESQLGPYHIVSLIGGGGMGEVYRARDTRLNRDVAIKIISSQEADEETLRRFHQEALAVSALNHPNILTIHDFGREDKVAFLVTELVDGESLRKRLVRGALSMRELLDIALQIADGLAAAHDEGIVHRDLKPENIMVTRDGRVKILDFGIAKVVEESRSDNARTISSRDTAPGLLLGTTAYMSPEQARGTRVSYFADQFALGAILFEMATGQSPFLRDNPLATLSAILTEDPSALTVGSPLFQWLIKRLLHKEPDHRYGSMHDVIRELRTIRASITEIQETSAEVTGVVEPPEPLHTASLRTLRVRPRWIALGLASLCALSAVSALVWYHKPAQVQIAREYKPFVTEPGLDIFPAWSPNGRTLAYSSEVNGTFQIFTRSAGAVGSAQITAGPADALFPFWSPDGARVYFISGGDLYGVSGAGGSPELVLRNVVQAAIAADGSLAALRPDQEGSTVRLYLRRPQNSAVWSAAAFREQRYLPSSYIHFSPNGLHLAAWLSLPEGRSELWVVRLDGSSVERKLRQLPVFPTARQFTWLSDNRRIVFSDHSGLSSGSHLLVADLDTGRVDPLTVGTGSEFSPAAAPGGRTIAFSSVSPDYNIVSVTFDGKTHPVLATPRYELSPTSEGRQLAYVTDKNGHSEIWLRTEGQTWERPVVTSVSFGDGKSGLLLDPVLSPDGRRIAFRRAVSGEEAIWIATVSGDSPVRLVAEPESAFQRGPSWSPEGDSIVYFSIRNGRYVTERARPGQSQPPSIISSSGGAYPKWSPRGDLIAAVGVQGIVVCNTDGSNARFAGSGQWLVHGWSEDGKQVYGLRRSAAKRLELVTLQMSDASERVLADMGQYPAAFAFGETLGLSPVWGFTLNNDHTGFLTSLLEAKSDIWTLTR